MAASGNFVLDKGFDAAAALTAYLAVKMSADETVTPIAAITDAPIGVVQFGVTTEEIAQGKGATVRLIGITEMVAGGAITVGALVCINATGQAVAATTGNRIIGVCVKGASGANARCSVLLTPAGHLAP